MESLYRDGRVYDQMHEKLVVDSDFFVQEATRLGGPVLEVACGTGRITLPIAKKGLETWGLDISESMLSEARKKSQDLGLKVNWVHEDCRNFNLGRKFKYIFIPFNSMLHLHDLKSVEDFFSCVKAHLAPDGIFTIDVFNPSIAILNRPKDQVNKVLDFIDPHSGEMITLEETMKYDAATQVNHIKWQFSSPSKKVFREEALDMRCFYPQELDALVKYNGFSIVEKFGNFDRSAFASSSPKQILNLKLRN